MSWLLDRPDILLFGTGTAIIFTMHMINKYKSRRKKK